MPSWAPPSSGQPLLVAFGTSMRSRIVLDSRNYLDRQAICAFGLHHGCERVSAQKRQAKAPAIIASICPRASAREFHHGNMPRLGNAVLALRKHSRVLRHKISG